MKNYFGWTGGSNMPALYVHLSGRDIDGGILKMHGMQPEEDTKIKLTIKTCNRCHFKNPPEAKYCNACGFVLDMQTAVELENKLGDSRFVEENVLGGDKDVKNMYAKLKEMEKKFDDYIVMKKKSK
jgi:ribosomal protein L40E